MAAPSGRGGSAVPLWVPLPERVARRRISDFARLAHAHYGAPVSDAGPDGYPGLHRWSVRDPERFWTAIWEYAAVQGTGVERAMPRGSVLVGGERMAPPDPVGGPRWFPTARLNFAENLLRWSGEQPALIAWSERGRERAMSRDELRAEVARMASAFAEWGVGTGDRVAGYLPNVPEAVIAMLAAASLGAIWSSCGTDFGASAALDRLGQIAPTVLVAADGYRYAGRECDLRERVAALAAAMPTVAHVALVPVLGLDAGAAGPRAVPWDALGTTVRPPAFAQLPFDHPLYVVYSSGTTGLPKCMVHGAGGTLLQHLKELALHVDLRAGDRICYVTTCGWMMWNWLVSSLALGATVVLYDGSPAMPRADALWAMAAAERLTVLGTSATYLALQQKAGARPREQHDLSALRTLLSTGSPITASVCRWVYDAVASDLHLASISGGTDLLSCFVLGNPAMPVYAGEIQVRGLGMAAEVHDDHGRPVRGVPGELVCTRPFPSMPVRFWNDPDGSRYRDAYFAHTPGAWRHGDWIEETATGGLVIHGRSDATLNPGGVRIGTAELYGQVEQLDEVIECLAVGQPVRSETVHDEHILLFVRLRDGLVLDDGLRQRIRSRLREQASPRHVPHRIFQVSELPRTRSGKVSELAVRAILAGRAVPNGGALENPGVLAAFRALGAEQDER